MKVVIAGYGVEGAASYEYWTPRSDEITIADEREYIDTLPVGAQTILGKDAFTKLDDYDLIIRSPGLNPKKLPYGSKVWSATNEFFEKCPAPIVGVTGTKGKGTTSSFIASILASAGKTVHLVGNIGTPALSELPNVSPDDIVVFELSSFQLWDAKFSPHIAVVLMVEADHLDVHDGMEDYIAAKANIRRHQDLDAVCIYHPTNEIAARIAATGDWPESSDERHQWMAQARRYASTDRDSVHAADGWFVVNNTRICSTEEVRLPGPHNLENACAAIMAARHLTEDNQAIARGLREFTGLPHRLRFVGQTDGIKFYDDSIATTPGSAIAAVRSFVQPKVLILGGHDKGADYTQLIQLCAETNTKVLAIGANGDVIAELCQQYGVVFERETGDMPAIVAKAHEIAQSGDVVILSPAAASFDMFTSYSDRGEQFVAAVQSLQA